MSSSIYVTNEITMSCNNGLVSLAVVIVSYIPISVRKSKMVTAGPMRGKIRANVEANTMAKMQAAVAKEGL